MIFESILFRNTAERLSGGPSTEPDFFIDLNLDQIVKVVTAGKDEYDLKPFFYAPLRDPDAVAFRHEIFQDLANASLFAKFASFAEEMRTTRAYLGRAEKFYYEHQKERWFLDAVERYCGAVTCLVHDLSLAEFTSRGLLAFRDYVTRYATSESFVSLLEQAKTLKADLSSIHYCVLINGLRVEVRNYEEEIDYSVEVEATFERFKQGAVKPHEFNFADYPEMNHVEAGILDLVAKAHPEVFSDLHKFYLTHGNYMDQTVVDLDREIQFYIAYIEYSSRFTKSGLGFCYPVVAEGDKEVHCEQGFDLALAGKLIGEHSVPVCNDFHLNGPERVIVVSGPNQGGKTTFARTFGQLHYLANLGCPVPGARAQLLPFDKLFTHFERGENIKDLRGKLEDDLLRVHDILTQASSNSIIIMNEIFTSTTLRDAIALSRSVLAEIIAMDLLCVWVTFVEELASLGEQTVSMVSTVDPFNPATRTYKITRQPANGLSYAQSIAEKYRLTYDLIRERLGR